MKEDFDQNWQQRIMEKSIQMKEKRTGILDFWKTLSQNYAFYTNSLDKYDSIQNEKTDFDTHNKKIKTNGRNMI